MRTSSLALIALISAVAIPAAFAKDAAKTPAKPAPTVKVNKKSLASCTTFDQSDKDEDTVSYTIKTSCEIPIDCTIQWKLVCAPASKTRRTEHVKSASFPAMGTSTSQTADASSSECGADSWELDDVTWSCAPNKD